MSPILSARGGMSANAYGWGALAGAATSFDSIATATAPGGTTTLSFSSIPGTYQHLHLRGIVRSETAGDIIELRINGVSSGYRQHRLLGNRVAASAANTTSGTGIFLAGVGNSGTSNSHYDVFYLDILDYASTTKTKVVRLFSGSERASSDSIVYLGSGLYNATTAITSLSVVGQSYNISSGSSVALYGIKGSA